MEPAQSRSNWGRVLLLVIAHSVTDLSQGALFVALPFFKALFGLSYAQASAIALVQNLTSSVSQPLFGYFSDRTARPWLMPAGCLLSGIGMVLAILSPSYGICLAWIAVSGLGIAAFHPEGAKTVNRWSGSARGKAVSMFVVGGNGGFALGSLLLAALLESGGWIPLYALPSLLAGGALFWLLRRMPLPLRVAVGQDKLDLRKLLAPSLLALLGMVLLRATVGAGISTFIPLYYVSYLQGDTLYASSLLTVYLAAGAVGTLLGGTLCDKFGSKRVMLASILPVAPLVAAFTVAGGGWIVLILATVSACLSATFASSLVLVQAMLPGNVALASGLALGLSGGLGGLGVVLLGRIADIWSLPVVFHILTLLPLGAFLLTLFIKEPKRSI